MRTISPHEQLDSELAKEEASYCQAQDMAAAILRNSRPARSPVWHALIGKSERSSAGDFLHRPLGENDRCAVPSHPRRTSSEIPRPCGARQSAAQGDRSLHRGRGAGEQESAAGQADCSQIDCGPRRRSRSQLAADECPRSIRLFDRVAGTWPEIGSLRDDVQPELRRVSGRCECEPYRESSRSSSSRAEALRVYAAYSRCHSGGTEQTTARGAGRSRANDLLAEEAAMRKLFHQ